MYILFNSHSVLVRKTGLRN